jgi:hypothetical protein
MLLGAPRGAPVSALTVQTQTGRRSCPRPVGFSGGAGTASTGAQATMGQALGFAEADCAPKTYQERRPAGHFFDRALI